MALMALMAVSATPRPAGAQTPGGDGGARLAAALATLPADPPVEVVLDAVLARTLPDDDVYVELARRARRRGWAPELRLEARRGQGWDLSSLQTGDTQDRRNLSTDDELTILGRLTFDLDVVVFAPEETALARERRAAAAERRAVVSHVVARYFERRRILLEIALGAPRDAETQTRLDAISAELEALAGRPLWDERGVGVGAGRARARRSAATPQAETK